MNQFRYYQPLEFHHNQTDILDILKHNLHRNLCSVVSTPVATSLPWWLLVSPSPEWLVALKLPPHLASLHSETAKIQHFKCGENYVLKHDYLVLIENQAKVLTKLYICLKLVTTLDSMIHLIHFKFAQKAWLELTQTHFQTYTSSSEHQ